MNPQYIKFKSSEGTCFIKKDQIDKFKEADVVIFDCDGVLIDVRDSYRRTVAETSSIILETLTGTKVNPSIFDDETFFAFKKTGCFNNDWVVTYVCIIGSLSILTDTELNSLNTILGRIKQDSPLAMLNAIHDFQPSYNLYTEDIKTFLLSLVKLIEKNGVDSIESSILSRVGVNVKNYLHFGELMGENIISTLFWELFCGTTLFKKVFGINAQLTKKQTGYIDRQSLILTKSTLIKIEKFIKGRRVGIASGSLMKITKYILGDIISNFPRNAQVWHEDIKVKPNEIHMFLKPNSYMLLRAARAYSPYIHVIYVGDTIADLLTTRNASTEIPKFSFIGVYANTIEPKKIKSIFISHGADAIIPTVNQLPLIFQKASKNLDQTTSE